MSQPDETFTLSRLHHVQLSVPRGSEEACRGSWGGVLATDELDEPPVLVVRGGCCRGGGVEVHRGVEERSAPARKAHPGIVVDGLPVLAARLEAAGPSPVEDALDHRAGHPPGVAHVVLQLLGAGRDQPQQVRHPGGLARVGGQDVAQAPAREHQRVAHP